MPNLLFGGGCGYSDSPLNARSANVHRGPEPGKRAPIREGEPDVGSGNTPRFACSQKIRSRRDRCFQNNRILSSLRRANSTPTGGIWVVRPDGYVTLAAKHDAWNEVEAYLSHLARAATA